MPVRPAERVAAVAPVALVALLAGWAGNLAGGVGGAATATAHAGLLGAAALAGRRWRDPLRLGRAGALLPVAVWVAIAASVLASPVPRAGRTALLLLPTLPLFAAVTGRAWATAERRRTGLVATAGIVATTAAWSLAAWRLAVTPGASAPLGHHNLLAAWLVALLPLAALLASGSLAGLAGLAAVAAGALITAPRRPRWALAAATVAGVAALALQAPRLLELARGGDPSALSRATYLRAAVAGIAERPLLGWGPGSVPWTVARFLRPVPAANPPGEVVSDLHSLPVHLVYELGATGALLVLGVAAVFVRRRFAERGADGDPALLRAALLGLLGLGVVSLGGLPLAVVALPAAAVLLAGAALAAAPPPPPTVSARGGGAWVAPVLAVVLALLLAPADVAHLAYDEAVAVPDRDVQIAALERAVALDPAFPLYRARLAWLRDDPAAALAAARDAEAVAALWLAAGAEAVVAGDDRSRAALFAACAYDPLSGAAPMLLTLTTRDVGLRGTWAGRAVLGDPRWLAAGHWTPDGLAWEAALRVEHLRGVPEAWRASVVDAARRAVETPPTGDFRSLAVGIDYEASAALSLYAFRRRPWPQDLVALPLRGELLPVVSAFPGAGETWGTSADVFAAPGCGLP